MTMVGTRHRNLIYKLWSTNCFRTLDSGGMFLASKRWVPRTLALSALKKLVVTQITARPRSELTKRSMVLMEGENNNNDCCVDAPSVTRWMIKIEWPLFKYLLYLWWKSGVAKSLYLTDRPNQSTRCCSAVKTYSTTQRNRWLPAA